MSTVTYRRAEESDIPGMARIRAAQGDTTEEHWKTRISGYLAGTHHPQKALMPRVFYVALDSDAVLGFIGGHLTRRFGCDGELQWINVIDEMKGSGMASELLRYLAAWFAGQSASRVCVNVAPANAIARRFYVRHGAVELNEHWLVWDDIKVVLES